MKPKILPLLGNRLITKSIQAKTTPSKPFQGESAEEHHLHWGNAAFMEKHA